MRLLNEFSVVGGLLCDQVSVAMLISALLPLMPLWCCHRCRRSVGLVDVIIGVDMAVKTLTCAVGSVAVVIIVDVVVDGGV